VVGLGLGGYSFDPSVGYDGSPQCWGFDPCRKYVEKALNQWLDLGGIRLDLANSYHNDWVVGDVLRERKTNISELFLLEKVGPSFPLGYQDSLNQWETMKSQLGVEQVDLLLIHWPFWNPSQGNVSSNDTLPIDPVCQNEKPKFDSRECAINTWRALLKIFHDGGARSVGVSNYNISRLEDIKNAGLPMPSVNQIPYHIYRSSSHAALLKYCEDNDILVVAYSPFGVSDWWHPPKGFPYILEHPVVTKMALKYGKTPSQVILRWLWHLGIPTNPRSQNKEHMIQNLESYDFDLDAADVNQLSSLQQITCAYEPSFYECAPAIEGN